MSACCRAIDDHFDAAKVQSQVADLAKNGPARETTLLIEQVQARASRGYDVLDIGAGLGVVAERLLAAGARRATLVDVSMSYHAAAQRRMADSGLAERVTLKCGDFLALADQLEPADIVTLDKVICCYSDMQRLVDQSARKARRLYAASYPRDNWLVRLAIGFENLTRRLRRKPFRAYVHPVNGIEQLLRANGFELCASKQTSFWRIVLFERVQPKLDPA